jgi:hypothetical protein
MSALNLRHGQLRKHLSFTVACVFTATLPSTGHPIVAYSLPQDVFTGSLPNNRCLSIVGHTLVGTCLPSRCLELRHIILRPTVSRPVCLGIKHRSGLKTRSLLLSDSFRLVDVGRSL